MEPLCAEKKKKEFLKKGLFKIFFFFLVGASSLYLILYNYFILFSVGISCLHRENEWLHIYAMIFWRPFEVLSSSSSFFSKYIKEDEEKSFLHVQYLYIIYFPPFNTLQ